MLLLWHRVIVLLMFAMGSVVSCVMLLRLEVGLRLTSIRQCWRVLHGVIILLWWVAASRSSASAVMIHVGLAGRQPCCLNVGAEGLVILVGVPIPAA